MLLKDFSSPAIRRLRQRFQHLYGSRAERCVERLSMLIGRYGLGLQPIEPMERWTEKDTVLITYGDIVRKADEKPLETLAAFLSRHVGQGEIRGVHILPFCPYSSDDGFSVIDYREVDDELGDWHDIMIIAKHYKLMVDIVLNHVSRRSSWFMDYVSGVLPAADYFIEVSPEQDLSSVVRPRNRPLLAATNTRAGIRHVWTTFSEDQIDLDFSNPDVLFEFLDILFFYITRGAQVFRLDAIAYLWKRLGTSCIHLPETHEIVKLFRDVLELISPNAILITETNVPHKENISYFGHGDEAHMVYQFSLPPLLLHALQTGNGRYLTQWAKSLGAPYPGCTYLNFTASHDGIGVRPLEGLVPREEFNRVVDNTRERGGHVSTKTNSDGSESPYELNITYFDALRAADDDDQRHIDRFLCSQAIAMQMQGIPAVYFHSLVGTRNDHEGVEQKGYPRAINRHKWAADNLEELLNDEETVHAQVLRRYSDMLRIRTRQPAFHPEADQRVLELGDRFFALIRSAPNGSEDILAVSNLSEEYATLDLDRVSVDFRRADGWTDLLGNRTIPADQTKLDIAPYQTLWLTP
ncbi:MAG: alpha-amylase family glycosyl hydrolase [bacterium]